MANTRVKDLGRFDARGASAALARTRAVGRPVGDMVGESNTKVSEVGVRRRVYVNGLGDLVITIG